VNLRIQIFAFARECISLKNYTRQILRSGLIVQVFQVRSLLVYSMSPISVPSGGRLLIRGVGSVHPILSTKSSSVMTSREGSTRPRRSSRLSVLTQGAKDYVQKQTQVPNFPSVRDEISVRWLLCNRPVWWPAAVTSIISDEMRRGVREVRATLLYHKLGKYSAEPASVIFTYSNKERLVRSVNSTGGDPADQSYASWRFAEEVVGMDDGEPEDETDEDSSSEEDAHHMRRVPRAAAAPSSPSSLTTGSTRAKNLQVSKDNIRVTPQISKRSHPNLKNRKRRNSTPADLEVLNKASTPHNSNSTPTSIPPEDSNHASTSLTQSPQPGPLTSKDKDEINIRLQLLERRMHDMSKTPSSALSSTAFSVIVALRWSFLKSLERPLKFPDHPSLSSHGLASHEVSVSVLCDYQTFRELSALLETEHNSTPEGNVSRRIAFSPSFNTIQSGSNAADDLNIIFSCLADLTSFLRVRDDNDFDNILSKEVVTETSTMLRILGTATIAHIGDTQQERGALSNSTSSVSATSERRSAVRLFVGTAPVQFIQRSDIRDTSFDPRTTFSSAVIEQECTHFCNTQKCFQEPWVIHRTHSNLSVCSRFDLDGTVPKKELRNYFVLNWSRLSAPSNNKWTRDVHDTGNNCPGQLRMTVPYVFFTARRTVRSLVSILDKNIETFMKVRSIIQSRSSSK